jgi:DNA uptake protein ComE-like DNA-binding protein
VTNFNSQVNRIPNWVWWSFCPTFGGLALVYAGHKSKTPAWVALGLGITTTALILSSHNVAAFIWLLQIVIAFSLKKKFLLKTIPKSELISTDTETHKLLPEVYGKVDINTCSKDELVYALGLPIVYANKIDAKRKEGYIFTQLEELTEVAGLPENYLPRLAPLIVFKYQVQKSTDFSWSPINTLSTQELVDCGLDLTIAHKITAERERGGLYKSVGDVTQRTAVSLDIYRHLL